jgi:hypothetical protein
MFLRGWPIRASLFCMSFPLPDVAPHTPVRRPLIYTYLLPCKQRGARRKTSGQLAQNPGHAASSSNGTATREVKVFSQA